MLGRSIFYSFWRLFCLSPVNDCGKQYLGFRNDTKEIRWPKADAMFLISYRSYKLPRSTQDFLASISSLLRKYGDHNQQHRTFHWHLRFLLKKNLIGWMPLVVVAVVVPCTTPACWWNIFRDTWQVLAVRDRAQVIPSSEADAIQSDVARASTLDAGLA